jgi:beta-glucosidase
VVLNNLQVEDRMKNKSLPGLVATLVLCGTAAVIVSACGGDDIVGPSDPDSVADARAAALVAKMTTDEKIQLVHGTGDPFASIGGPFPPGINGAGYIPCIPRLGIPAFAMADSTSGVNVRDAGATALPAPIALAASWDTDHTLASDFRLPGGL